jgi:hypothetical protein
MWRWPGNERAVLSARCLGIVEPNGAKRTSGEGASTGTVAKRRVPPIETGPVIEAPEKPQQAGQQAGRQTAKPKIPTYNRKASTTTVFNVCFKMHSQLKVRGIEFNFLIKNLIIETNTKWV